MLSPLASHAWAYPALEIVHILGISLLLGNLFAFELRAMGAAAHAIPIRALARLSLSLSLAGFSLVAASGLLMFATQPEELLANRAFTLKMGLLFVAGGNAAWFHARCSLEHLDLFSKIQLSVSIVLWITIVACGRWIAYS